MKYQIIQGDNRETLKNIPDNSIDAIVTDPPYGIDFLGKQWDVNTGELETYEECLRVLKPGGHILAFSAARTYHHLAMTLERAGFEIRDQIMWIYSSGFPKSQDIGRSIQRGLGVKEHYSVEEWEDKQGYSVNHPGETYGFGDPNSKDGHGDAGLSGKIAKVTDPEAQAWEGWGTALKPAHEPIALARKPVKGSIKNNVQKWGTGAINIDATRIPLEDNAINVNTQVEYSDYSFGNAGEGNKQTNLPSKFNPNEAGRFPSNVIGEILQEDYQKYFYCPKVSRKERHMGFDTSKIPTNPSGMLDKNANGVLETYQSRQQDGKLDNGNNHPTVKPVALMEYLIKLITPPGGTVLDPFNGSGSTGMAATGLGFNYIGLELDPNYVAITENRIKAWLKKDESKEETTSTFKELFEQCP